MGRYLTTGGAHDPFLPELLGAIRQANEIDLAVAFIRNSGLALLYAALVDAVETRGARLRVLTSDYLDVTEPNALRRLLLLGERGAEIRLFEALEQSFHLKAYVCVRTQDGSTVWGTAFVGSSNISRSALLGGLEWNLRVDAADDLHAPVAGRFQQIRDAYEALLAHPQVRPLDHTWIEAYEQRRQVLRRLPVLPVEDGPEDLPPQPNEVQIEALAALAATRSVGYQRGLVVMATGLGKTYLAAFDSQAAGANRVLFVAHREEILLQAEVSFLQVRPAARVGRYSSAQKDLDAEMLFASIQTIGRAHHLRQFAPDHFDYVVVDEFHHAAAPTYRKLLQHFSPRFLLGLTATPERTDQSDILSLCDDNLVYSRGLFDGITLGLLCPFRYYGIYDETVDYQEIPWRNGRFDPESLSNKLSTLGRAQHAMRHWREKRLQRTLAFCVSRRHADFMAERFRREGIRGEAVYQGSNLDRSEALEQLERGALDVVFSVDLFNEGVDLPAIDTILMLRPTESRILFLQQLGRGLRLHPDKEHVVVLDFIGNHRGFFNKPQVMFDVGSSPRAMADFARRVRDDQLQLPPGCYVNYDLAIIDFLERLQGQGPAPEYKSLRDSLGRRQTLAEFYRSESNLTEMRRQFRHWWGMLQAQGDLTPAEEACLSRHAEFLREVETTPMTRSFKAVLLQSMLDLDGFRQPPTLDALAMQALAVFRRRRHFIGDIRKDLQDLDHVKPSKWVTYWRGNPINAWIGGNRSGDAKPWFELEEGRFKPTFTVDESEWPVFAEMLKELVDYRLAAYEPRLDVSTTGSSGPDSEDKSQD